MFANGGLVSGEGKPPWVDTGCDYVIPNRPTMPQLWQDDGDQS